MCKRNKSQKDGKHLLRSYSQWGKELRFELTSVRASNHSAKPYSWGAESIHARVLRKTHDSAYISRISSDSTLNAVIHTLSTSYLYFSSSADLFPTSNLSYLLLSPWSFKSIIVIIKSKKKYPCLFLCYYIYFLTFSLVLHTFLQLGLLLTCLTPCPGFYFHTTTSTLECKPFKRKNYMLFKLLFLSTQHFRNKKSF